MKANHNTQGHLAALFSIIIWGTTFISTKLLLNDFKPVEILLYRFLLGIVFLTILYPHRFKIQKIKQEILFALAGLCGITFYFLLENIALTYTKVSNVGVIVSVSPLVTAIFAAFLLKGEKLKVNFFIGFLTAITGIIMISVNSSTVLKLNSLGDLLAFGAAVVWAAYSVISRKISTYGYNTIQTTRRVFFYGILFMLPALYLFNFKLQLERFTDPINLFNILFLGLGASAICFVTWNIALKALGAVKTSIYIYMVPVITVITSILILKERLNVITFIGLVLTMLGLIISNKNTMKEVAKSTVQI